MAGLKTKLGLLQKERGLPPPAPASAPATNAAPASSPVKRLADRLRDLRAPSTAPPRSARAVPSAEEMAERLGGVAIAPGLVQVERRVPLDGRHGKQPLTALRDAVDLPDAPMAAPHGWLFLDTETSGLSGGTGTVAFLLGLARVEKHELVVRQFMLTAFAGEPALFEAAKSWFDEAEAFVSFNGKAFDLPLLATRARLNGRHVALDKPHLDLLHATRRAFASRWDDCRLATAERRLIRFEREHDLPGALVPEVWFGFVQRGETARIPAVLEHNHWDLVSLAALLPILHAVHQEPGAWESDILAVARSFLRSGDEPRAHRLLAEHEAMLTPDGLRELAWLYRRRGDWQQACALWSRLAGAGCVESIERLAKYHEHVVGDFTTALAYAQRLGDAHEARRARLLRRLRD